MDAEQLETVCKNGLMRSVYLMCDSSMAFEKLLELPPRNRLKVLEKVAGTRKLSVSDVMAADKKLDEQKTLKQMQFFN